MTITGQSSLNKDDIDRMVRDAEAHAEDDKRRREEVEVRNTADSLVYQTEKLLKDQAESFSGTEKDSVEANLKTLKEALEGNDMAAIKAATDTLASSSQELGRKLYEASAAQGTGSGDGGADGAGATGANDDEVVDAEIVDDEKK